MSKQAARALQVDQCAGCGHTILQCRYLIAFASRLRICEECVAVCHAMIVDATAQDTPPVAEAGAQEKR